MTSDSTLDAFQTRLGVRFRRSALLWQAITHQSYANEKGLDQNYERLEFLGDAVLGTVAAEWLYKKLPDTPEGGLSEVNAYLVSRPVLAEWAVQLDLGEVIRLGVGEERSGGREKPSLLADAMEAVIGAVFLDRGLGRVRHLLAPMFEEAFEVRESESWADAKTRLQELTQARSWALPEYRHVSASGPDHRKRFRVECWIAGSLTAAGEGRSKKVAEQRSATAALAALAELAERAAPADEATDSTDDSEGD